MFSKVKHCPMGNLYTHILPRKHDKRIEILSFLKAAWHTTPRDYPYIKRLQQELKKLENKQYQHSRHNAAVRKPESEYKKAGLTG